MNKLLSTLAVMALFISNNALSQNIALNKPVTFKQGSTITPGITTITDGNKSTPAFTITAYQYAAELYIDLGAFYDLSSMNFYWGTTYYAKNYQISTSSDNVTYTSRLSVSNNTSSTDTRTFSSSISYVRWVKIDNFSARGVSPDIYRIDVYEIEIMGAATQCANPGTFKTLNVCENSSFAGTVNFNCIPKFNNGMNAQSLTSPGYIGLYSTDVTTGIRMYTGSTYRGYIGYNGTYFSINDAINFKNGNIGFGTTNPTSKLELAAEGNQGGDCNASHPFYIRGTDQVLYMGTNSTAHLSYIQAASLSTQNDNLVLNYIHGNVGIGTITAPTEKLEVNGKIKANGLEINTSGDPSTTEWDNHAIKLWDNAVSPKSVLYMGVNTANGLAYMQSVINGVGAAPLIINSRGGSVGIGTTSTCSGYLLTVNGGITCKEVKVVSSICSDFVFKPEYKLRSLKEVESYVKENSHLPEIPSSAELKETGYKVGEMDDILLRKVEELTLYVIEQNKQIEELRNELAKTKTQNK